MRLAALSVALIGLTATGASALPAISIGETNAAPLAEPVASWRYHRRCGWHGGRWVVDLGQGKLVICRPYRPGRDYEWRSEGGHEGWYHRRHKTWHFKNW